MRFPLLRLVSTAFLATLCAFASPESEMTAAAKHFLASLNDDQRAAATFEFKSDERENWHFIPKDRKGVTLGHLKPAQRHLAFALLQSGLSNRGFAKATTIMSLEQILQELEGPNRRFPRDPELYHVSIFGTPDAQGTWGWRFEGHHLSLNFTLVKGKFAAGTPSIMDMGRDRLGSGGWSAIRLLPGGLAVDAVPWAAISLWLMRRRSGVSRPAAAAPPTAPAP